MMNNLLTLKRLKHLSIQKHNNFLNFCNPLKFRSQSGENLMSSIVLYISQNRRPMIFGYAAACTQFVFWASIAEWSLHREDDDG
jgi:hypothetical protein